MTKILITGMSRSGTTLMDRWLNALPGCTIHSQPLPYLFRHAKQRFYEAIKRAPLKYPFCQFFGEDWYDINWFEGFLNNWLIKPEEIRSLLVEMQEWSGQKTKIFDIDAVLPNGPVSFSDAVSHILNGLPVRNRSPHIGLKEILCEEFVPTLAAQGWKIILIIRNPLDVLSSIQFGGGAKFTGARRPTLFHLRNWRRSAQIAALAASEPNVHVVRFEDVILRSESTLRSIVTFLGLEWQESFLQVSLKNPDGATWTPNTSFKNRTANQALFDQNAVNHFLEVMPQIMRRYIEVLCAAEMNYFGYEHKDHGFEAVENFSEPFRIESEDFRQNYSEQDQIDLERIRYGLSRNEAQNQKTINNLFATPTVLETLRTPSGIFKQ